MSSLAAILHERTEQIVSFPNNHFDEDLTNRKETIYRSTNNPSEHHVVMARLFGSSSLISDVTSSHVTGRRKSHLDGNHHHMGSKRVALTITCIL